MALITKRKDFKATSSHHDLDMTLPIIMSKSEYCIVSIVSTNINSCNYIDDPCKIF